MLFCYKCGVALSEKSFCTSCGADVGKYKKIIYMSNRYYNRGLERAQIRDLSGAAEELRQSLKLYKRNTQARNLLGLVYFEMGETVNAMSEWVLSAHFQQDKNLANDYIEILQANATLLDTLNSSIRKYNQALTLCKQDSLDVAKISLRRIVSNNPRLLSAHLLLALILLKEEDYAAAKKELLLVRKIDKGNVQAALYLRMVEENLNTDSSNSRKKKKNEASVTFQSGNDIIIQPSTRKDNALLNVFLNIFIGLVIGLLAGWFIIGPIRVNLQGREENEELAEVREQLDLKSTTVDELNKKIQRLNTQNESLSDQINAYEGANGAFEGYRYMLLAMEEYNKGAEMDKAVIAKYLDKIDENNSEKLKETEFLTVYNQLKAAVGESVADQYYADGFEAFKNEDYVTAFENFKKAVDYDPTNVDALYYLACTYKENKDYDNAKFYYNKVLEAAPDSEIGTKAKNYIQEIETM